jgi:hypothetical protein
MGNCYRLERTFNNDAKAFTQLKKKLYSYFSVHFTSTILQDTEISVFMISTSFKIGVICGIFFVINDKRYDGFIIVNNDNMYYLGCLVLLSNYYCR